MVTQLFWIMGIKKPSYIDIGAHHPFNISNTALLYSRGSRGVNVEANPNLMQEFVSHRPDDVNVSLGVGVEPGFKTFYMWDDHSGRNTFSEEASKRMEVLTKTISIQMHTLDAVVKRYCRGRFPDFMSIDIEGLDYDVLQSADFSESQPRVICAEVHYDETERFVAMMARKGYSPVCRMAMDIIFIMEAFKKACHIP